MSEEQPQTLNVDGMEYPLSEFSDQQKYMLNQVQDLSGKASNLRFQLDQAEVAKQWFTDNLIASLKSEESDDGMAGADITNQ
jgi:hypothetical protein